LAAPTLSPDDETTSLVLRSKGSTDFPTIYSKPLQSIEYALAPTIEERALSYHHKQTLSDMTPQQYHTTLSRLLQESDSACRNTLELASTAIILTTFGQSKHIPKATYLGAKKYGQALNEFKEHITKSELVVTDELLLTTMLLCSYEVWTISHINLRMLS